MNIKKIFKQFGYWATPRLGTEYPSVCAGIKGADDYRYRIDPISEELAMQIEKNILIMRKVDLSLYDVFMLRYVYRADVADVVNHYRISRAEYFNRLRVAEKSLELMLTKDECILIA